MPGEFERQRAGQCDQSGVTTVKEAGGSLGPESFGCCGQCGNGGVSWACGGVGRLLEVWC